MRRMGLSLVALGMALVPAAAQSPVREHYLSGAGLAGSGDIEKQFDPPILPREKAEPKEKQFRSKTQAFVDLWTAFAREYSEKGTFNVKLARELSKAFHALEKTEGWPKVDHK